MFSLTLVLINLPFLSIFLSVLAYIDPGTGSIIMQALVATVVGAAIAVKLYWHRLLKFFGLRKGKNSETLAKPDDISKKTT